MLELSQIFREKKFYFDLLKELKITKISCSVEENVQYDALYDYCIDRNLYHRGLVKEDSNEKVLIPVFWEWKDIKSIWDHEYYVLDLYAVYVPDSIMIECSLINKMRDITDYVMCSFTREEFEKNGFEVSIDTEYPEEEEDV